MKVERYRAVITMLCALLDEQGKKACVVVEGIAPERVINSVAVERACGVSNKWRWYENIMPPDERRSYEKAISESLPMIAARIRVVETLLDVKDGEEVFVICRKIQQAIDTFADVFARHHGNAREAILDFEERCGWYSSWGLGDDEAPFQKTEAIDYVAANPVELGFALTTSNEDDFTRGLVFHQLSLNYGFVCLLLDYLSSDISMVSMFFRRVISIEDSDFKLFKAWFVAWMLYSGHLERCLATEGSGLFPWGREGGKFRYVKREDELFEVPIHDYQNELFFIVRGLSSSSDMNLFIKNLTAIKRLLPERPHYVSDDNDHDVLWYLFAAQLTPEERNVYSGVLCTYLELNVDRETKWGVSWKAVHYFLKLYEIERGGDRPRQTLEK